MTKTGSRLKFALATAVIVLTAASCSDVFGGDFPEPGSVLFEVEYQNSAWGWDWHGFWIDAEGRVFSFDVPENRWDRADGEVFSERMLRDKYDHGRELVKTLPPGEAEAKYALVGAVVQGALSERRGVCADAGTMRFSAMVYDPMSATYRRVLLHMRGDQAQTNTSPAARELLRWLEEVTGTANPGGHCDPFGD